ncbi:MAG TPA: hypothetical protein VGA03_05365 [Anaerolineales bacterium]|jgi:ubiquinone/menaquinone biosynthesis C-methylase UbiE
MNSKDSRPDTKQTRLARSRYDRIAPAYDLMNWLGEAAYRRWQEWLWRQVPDHGRILEVGIGTGKNLPIKNLVLIASGLVIGSTVRRAEKGKPDEH